MSTRTRMAIGAIVGVLVVLYLNGAFDRALYPMGLNFHECGQNGFGAVFCGDALKSYEQEVIEPAKDAQRETHEIEREVECSTERYYSVRCPPPDWEP